MATKVLHIANCDKFIPPFIEFVKDHLNFKTHQFYLTGGMAEKDLKEYPNVKLSKKGKINRIKEYLQLIISMHQSKKIILHGLFNRHIVIMLFFMPWLLKKCYWVMWGGDFYFPEKHSWFKKQVIKKIGHFVTYIKGDYELAQKWYKTKGKYHECFMYPSNLYKEYDIKPKGHNSIDIQLGNSADPTNNHIDVLKNLEKYKDEDIQIFAPLSYGDQEYAKEVIAYGKDIFREKFIPLTEFMAFEKYLEFLGSIDIAIFAHKRQQAMGNTITLLGLGKKVYMRNDITPWQLFNDIDVKLYDINDIQIDLIDKQIQKENQQKIKEYFSKENYLKQLEYLFKND